MINHDHKFVFIHIPKTAGTSIERFFGHNAFHKKFRTGIPNKEIMIGFDSESGKYFQHLTLSEIHDLLGDGIASYFSFGFVRNPWSKIVSSYSFYKDRGFNCFKDFLLSSKIPDQSHLIPQYNFLFDGDRQLVDFIGRFENRDSYFELVCQKIGVPYEKLPCNNKGDHNHYTEYYDDETRQIVSEKYAKDIEYFGYEFGE
jgi:hypothetical protein